MHLSIRLQQVLNPADPWPAQIRFCSVHVAGHLHFGGKFGAFPVAFVVPHGARINESFDVVFIGIIKHANERIHIVDFPIGRHNGPGEIALRQSHQRNAQEECS